MNDRVAEFTNEQRKTAIHRLTALWAFSESGLGGVLHALQVPFTGLIVGGMAILLITLIAWFSQPNYRQVLQSTLIVLIVKAMVSPHTPPTAYLAVSFQGLLGFGLFSLLRINLVSILFLAVISMLESALQKLLVLALFAGKSFLNAAQSFTDTITRQFGVASINGVNWTIGIYLSIYVAGGLLMTWLSWKTIRDIFSEDNRIIIDVDVAPVPDKPEKKSKIVKIWAGIAILAFLSLILFFIPQGDKGGWLPVLKALTWTLTVIIAWYGLVNPLLTRAIQRLLKKNESRYSEKVNQIVAFFPELKHFAYCAWQQSRQFRGWKRIPFFCRAMVQWSLTGLSNNP